MKRKIILLIVTLFLCGGIALLLCSWYKASSDKAVSVVWEKYHVNVTNTPKLKIYHSSPRRLAWYIETDSLAPEKVWVNALSGEIIYADYPADYFGGA